MSKCIVIDTETSGVDETKNQILSIGMIVTDTEHWEPLDDLYLELKFDERFEWSDQAFKIHGLSKEHLTENGMSLTDARILILDFIRKHFKPFEYVVYGGANTQFDMRFLNQLLADGGIQVKHLKTGMDINSLYLFLVGYGTTNKIFESIGFDKRDSHNALEDAAMTLEAFRIANELLK